MIKELRYILLISLLIFSYGSYNIVLSIVREEPLYLIWTAFCYSAVTGLLLSKNWSKYLVYFLAFVTVAGWLYFTTFMALNGWPYYETSDIVILFTVGLFLILTGLFSSIYVYRHFKNKP